MHVSEPFINLIKENFNANLCACIDKRMMNRNVGTVCAIAGKRLDGGIGQPTMHDSTQTAEAMQSPVLPIDRATVTAAAQQVLNPSLTATEAVKEVSRRLQVFGKSLPGTPVHMQLCRRQAIAIINSGVMEPYPYKYFLTYGSNDRYWPEIPIMVRKLSERNRRATTALALGKSTILGLSASSPPVSVTAASTTLTASAAAFPRARARVHATSESDNGNVSIFVIIMSHIFKL